MYKKDVLTTPVTQQHRQTGDLALSYALDFQAFAIQANHSK